MSFMKYRIKEVATDFGVAPKEISAIVEKFFEKPKSPSQILSEEELNVVFDYMTQTHQIQSLEQVFAVAAKKPEPAKAEPKPQPQQNKPQQTAHNNNNNARPAAQNHAAPKAEQKPQKPAEPERKR